MEADPAKGPNRIGRDVHHTGNAIDPISQAFLDGGAHGGPRLAAAQHEDARRRTQKPSQSGRSESGANEYGRLDGIHTGLPDDAGLIGERSGHEYLY